MADADKMPLDNDPTAADAEWKKIQQRTFTRWCNEHLKVANIVIYDLETDLCDGIKLIVLLEVLSHKRVGRYNKKPKVKSQKLENVAIALKFIESENIKVVNIDASDIVKGNLKLILGLIWTLILKYQISMPMGDYEFDDDHKDDKKKDSGMTPKQALLAWVKSKLPPEIPMNNFTTDWNDGRAIAALVDAIEPGLYPDVDPEDLDPNDALNNAKTAMDTADKYLGVPPILDPKDMCNPKCDELSIMTYVSYFPDAKVKPNAPHRPQLPPAAKCSAEGPGITPQGLIEKQSAPFTVFAAHAGVGSPQVSVVGPERRSVPCEVVDNGDKTFSCNYTPPQKGIYDVHIKWKGRHIPKSPFRVKVASDLDSSKCYAEGPGLNSGIVEHQWTNFTVFTKGAGEGKIHVDIIDPHLSKVEMKVEEKGDGEYYVIYKPSLHGKHTINIKFGGEHIAKSPFHVDVVSSKKDAIPSKVKAYGPGLEPKGVVATTETTFTVETHSAGDGDLKVVIKGPKGEIPCEIRDNGDGTFTCVYSAPVAGRYTITITWAGKTIPRSPFKIDVSPYVDITKIKAYGPGLERGVSGQPCKFTVETNGAPVDTLGFKVEGPHQTEIKCKDLGNGKCEVIYYPSKPGDYTVHVTCNGQDIPKGPFEVPIVPGGDASKCYAEGPGLEPNGVVAGVPAEFTVYTKGAGVGEVVVTVKDDKTGRSIPVETKDNKDGTTTVVYNPDKPGKYTITVTFNGKPIPKSPFKVNISLNNPNKCKAYGPGLEKSTVGEPAKFTIETKGAGEGGLGLTIEGPTEAKVDYKDNNNGSCDVTYYPETPGDYNINILFADKHIPGSPFKAKSSKPLDASKVVIGGPGLKPGVKAGLPADIDIDTREAGDAPLEVEVLNPLNKKVKVDVDEEEPGVFAATYYPDKPGKYTVNVKYGGKHVPKSPAKIDVKPKADASKCTLKGPGLESPFVNEPTKFDVDCKRAGEGNLVPTITSPSGEKVKPEVKDKGNGTYSVEYTPTEEGPHTIDVKYDGDSIPGTPKKVDVLPKTDTGKVKAFGPGLENVLTGVKAPFTVDTREAGPGNLSIAVEGPSEAKIVCKDNGDGTCSATYVPEEPGNYQVHVKYSDEDVPGSPFTVKATRPVDASKVKCYGPGVERAPLFETVPTSFTVDTAKAGDAPLDVTIETPDRRKIKPDEIKKIDDDKFEVKYTPPKEGRYAVDVKYGDKPVANSPFRVRAGPPYDASKVKVTGPAVEKTGIVPDEITKAVVDTTEAGLGDLSALLETPSGKKIEPTITPIPEEPGKYEIAYVPEETGNHKLNVKYGKDHVKDSPFRVKVAPTGDASKVKVSGDGLKKPPVGQLVDIIFDTTEAGKGKPRCTIKSPSGKDVPVNMIDNGDGTYTGQWTPTEEGVHDVDVTFGGEPVRGSPFKVEAVRQPIMEDIQAVSANDVESALPSEEGPDRVIAFGKGLEKGIVQEPCEFTVITKDAGPGGLSLAVEGPSKAEIHCVDNGDGSCSVSYLPEKPGEYNVVVKFADKHIPGSPFIADIYPKGTDLRDFKRDRPVVGKPCDVKLDMPDVDVERDFDDLTGTLKRPGSNREEPVELTKNPDGTVGVTFTPYEPGEHLISIKKRGKHVQNSPFSVLVQAPRLGDLFSSGHPADVDLSEIKDLNPEDFDKLTATLRRPKSKVEENVRLIKYPDDAIGVSFVPREPGEHFLTVKKNGRPIPGSPFSILVEAEEPVNAVGAPVDAVLDLPDLNLPDDFKRLKGTLKRPSSNEEEPLNLVLNSDNTLSVSFIPHETGKHLVGVKKFNRHVNGSPIPVMVTSPEPVNRVEVPCGVGLEDIPCEELPNLEAGLQRPGSNVEEPVRIKKNSDDTLSASFVPHEKGPHKLHVRKDKKPLPESPYIVDVSDKDDVEEVYPVGRTCDLGLDIPGVSLPEDFNKLEATLQRPNSDKQEPLNVELYPDDTLGISFVPLEPGEHLVRVKKSGEEVPGSPFAIMVEAAEAPNAVGKPCDCKLDIPELKIPDDLPKVKSTLKRPGSNVEEPIKLKVLSDNTISASFVPKSPGEHLISVKKDNRHLTGSPFPIMVTADEPVNRVGKPVGVGLEEIPAEDLPRLEAGLQRPGSEVEEPVRIKQNSDDTLSAQFIPHEEGVHKLHIRKDKKPLPESPYLINVLGKDAVEEVHPVGRTCDVGLDVPSINPAEDFDKLTATLQRPSSTKEEPVTLELNPDNSIGVTFVPKEPGTHWLHVRKSGKEIPESPFPIKVEPAKPKDVVGSPCDVPVDVENVKPEDLPKLTATLKRPGSKTEEPVEPKITSDGNLSVSFIPKSPGEHLITVKKRNKSIPGSPFSVMVTASEPACDIGKPSTVPLENIPSKDLPKLDAGLLRPGSKIEEPITIKKTSDDNLYAPFFPHEEGLHQINVRKNGKPVPDSPYTVDVPPKDEKIPVEEVYPVERPCDVALDVPSVNVPKDFKKLTGALQRPNSTVKEPLNLEMNPDDSLGVTFVPKEPGEHFIHVKKSGKDLPESPFSVMVEPEQPEYAAGAPCDVPLDVGDLKPDDLPKLTATLKRPGSNTEEPVKPKILSDGNLSVSFVPKSPGEHLITVKKRNRPVPGSPFSVMVTAPEPVCEIGKPSNAPLENIPSKDLPKLDAGLLRPGSTKEEPVPVKKTSDDNLYVPFIPHEAGPHKINVRKDGKPVPDSPFMVDVPPVKSEEIPVEEVYPLNTPCDLGMDIPSVKKPEDFKKLTGTLQRPGSKKEEPVELVLNPDNTIGVTFVPKSPGEHLIRIKKSGKEIPESPISVVIEPVEPEKAVGAPCDVPLDVEGLNLPDDLPKLTATLKRPGSNVEEPVEPKATSDGNLSVSFVPKSPGEHLITVKKRNRPVPGSPFSVMVTAPEPPCEIGKPSNAPLENIPSKDLPKLDAGLLRPGSTKEEPVPVKKTSDDNLYVPFIPHEAGPHRINVRKDGTPVPDSPYIVDVPEKVSKKPPVEELHPVGKACDFGLDIPGVNIPGDFKKLSATLQRPSSKKEEPLNLELNPDNTLGISFVPTEPGKHLVHVKKSGEEVPGSPFEVMVEAAEAVNAVGRPCDCHLDIPGLNLPADLSKLKSTLKRPDSDTEEPIKLKVLSDNTLSASFVPRSPGEHLISVKKFNRHLSGSPFSVMVSAPDAASQSVGRPCGVGLEIPGLKLPEDFDLLTGVLKRPGSTVEEPLKLILNSDNTLSVSFIPKETGEHFVSVFKNKRHVSGSPFSVMVSGPGPANASKVKAYGPGLKSGVADEKSEFTVNTRDAGYGGLGLSIEGPSKANINCVDNGDGTCAVDFVPTEPGDYTIHVRFADEEIPGSPFSCKVAPKGSKRPVVDEGITREMVDGVESAPAQRTSQLLDDLISFSPQEPHDFDLDLAGYDLKNLKATVETPSGKTEPAEIVETENDTYTIRFVTKEGGIYKIYVKNRGRDIPGSPFRVKVEAPKWGGAGKCSAAGPGLERGVVNQPANFTVWTRDAGPGGLAVAIEGPAKTEINCKDNGDGSCSITYVPTEPGEYAVHVRFADENIPGAPFNVFVTAEEDERFRDLSVSDMLESGIIVGQPASFSVQTNGPVGKVTASVITPSGSESPATVSDRGNGSYAIRFVPKEVGIHFINVRFDGVHIPGSPFKVKVGGGESYPSKVKAYGPGLEGGVAGEETYFTVDALRAGTGALSLSVDGPAKVRMNCTENPDGTYKVTYHPVIAGEYKIVIKFADQNIPKSPYNVTISSDGSSAFAEKCKPVGSGLHRAVIGEPNAFTVNCSDAGRGSLMVGVEGPAIPAKEIKIKHTGGKVYAVNYTLEEPGEYVLKVLWGEKHIPGSPFHVTV